MKIKEKIGEWIGKSLRALGVNTPGLMDYFLFGGGNSTASGVRVTESNALLISTVHQCVRVISDTVASLPCFLYRRVGEGKARANAHPLYRVLHEEPNDYMSPFEFKQTMQGWLCLWGNAFAEIERNGRGDIVALWPLRPDAMRLQIYRGEVFYYYTQEGGGERQLRSSEVFHLRGLSSDGLIGYSPIQLARETLGLAKASEDYRSRFFANDARPGGILMNPGELGDLAYARLRKAWEETHTGTVNRGRVAILEKGTTWQDVGVPPDDAQFIEGQEYQRSDIAAIFRVPGYKIGLLKPGTVSYASVEQQAIDFVVDCIRPWLVCWEERATLSLLTPSQRENYFAEFLVDALLRGDSAQRAQFYTAMFNIGALTQNEIRAKENMNGFGADGDRHYVPMNMVPVDLVDKMIEDKTQAEPVKPAQLNGAAH